MSAYSSGTHISAGERVSRCSLMTPTLFCPLERGRNRGLSEGAAPGRAAPGTNPPCARALWAARGWYWKLRNARVDAAEVWASLRVWWQYDLGEEYLADALQHLARRHGLD